MIIALGESIVAIGTGLGDELDAGKVAAALLGLVLAFGLWWAYFDVVAIVAERHFREAQGVRRLRIARDSYSYLHLPMIAGHRADRARREEDARARGRAARHGAGRGAVRRRRALLRRPRRVPAAERAARSTGRGSSRSRVCLALIPLGTEVDAFVALALAAAVTSAVIAYEAIRYAEARRRVRHESA